MTPRICRTDRGRFHSYTIDGHKAVGVTTVTGTLPKYLTKWAVGTVVDRLQNEWDALLDMAPSDRWSRLLASASDDMNAKAQRGKDIHALADKMVGGEAVKAPDDILGPAEALARFYDRWDVDPVATEAVVGHPGIRVAGTLDLVAGVPRLSDLPVVLDIKTGKGVYESDAMQVNAYAHMALWQPRGPESEEAMPTLGGSYIAHVLADDVEVYPVANPDELWRVFRHVLEVQRWLARLKAHEDAPFEDVRRWDEEAS